MGNERGQPLLPAFQRGQEKTFMHRFRSRGAQVILRAGRGNGESWNEKRHAGDRPTRRRREKSYKQLINEKGSPTRHEDPNKGPISEAAYTMCMTLV